jgi:hypothetical protein
MLVVDAIEAPLHMGERELADESLVYAVPLYRGKRRIFRSGLTSISEFKTADPQAVRSTSERSLKPEEPLDRKHHSRVPALVIRDVI